MNSLATKCIEWTGNKWKTGYGRVYVKDQEYMSAHRYFYERYVGPIEDGMFILHSCDNPGCVNPSHLRQGTFADNMQDKVDRDRVPHTDRDEYTFTHIMQGTFTGRRTQFCKTYGLDRGNVCRLIQGNYKSVKGWRLVSADTKPRQDTGHTERPVGGTQYTKNNHTTGRGGL